MVQMPVDPNKDWVIYTGRAGYASYKHMILDFGEQHKQWDDDIARCMLFIHIREGGVLRVRKEDNELVTSMDGRLIKGHHQNEAMITSIIEPLIVDLHSKVLSTIKDINDLDASWSTRLPGVTKIKIYMRRYSTNIYYMLQHKLGRNGGKNYHTTGVLILNTNEPGKTSKQV